MNQHILCQESHFIWNTQNQMQNLLQKWLKLWNQMTEVEKILYTTEGVELVLGNLYQCLNITEPKEFETIDQKRLTNCIGNKTYGKTKRETG